MGLIGQKSCIFPDTIILRGQSNVGGVEPIKVATEKRVKVLDNIHNLRLMISQHDL
jgi:hypothetical protein